MLTRSHAVAEVEPGRMTALPVAPVRVHRLAPVQLTERDLLDAELVQEPLHEAVGIGSEPRAQHDSGLGERPRAGRHRVGGEELVDEAFMPGLLEDDGQQHRRIDDHTPSSP
jgi:hypothetical protein